MTDLNTSEASAAPAASETLGVEVAQVYQLMTCALEAWSAYWIACFSARRLDDLWRANAELAAEGFTIAGQAAAQRQSIRGVVTPTLNEP